jgi:hypothetical protein
LKIPSIILLAVLLVACAPPQTPEKIHVSKPARELPAPASILFIGNSYSFDVPEELRRTAARDGRKLHVKQVTNGGWTLKQHAENDATLQAIREGGWDFVVIQEQSVIPSQPLKRTHAMFPHVRKLAAEARGAGAVPVLYQTWGRRDGNERLLGMDDFHAMNRRLRDGYQQAARHAGGLTIVPVGDAWEKEVNAGRGAELYQKDGSHPTARGNQLAARVFYQTLFAEAL